MPRYRRSPPPRNRPVSYSSERRRLPFSSAQRALPARVQTSCLLAVQALQNGERCLPHPLHGDMSGIVVLSAGEETQIVAWPSVWEAANLGLRPRGVWRLHGAETVWCTSLEKRW